MKYVSNWFFRYLPLLVLLIWVMSSCSQEEKRRVLVIHSYESTYAAYPEFNHKIAKQFKKEGVNADIRVVYLDCEAYLAQPELERMSFMIDSITQVWRPEVILVNEDQATYSLLKCGALQVKEIPIVFAGVNYPNWKLLEKFPNVTGFHDKIKLWENIEVTREITGKNNRLFTILDSTYLDMQVRRDAESQFKDYKVIGFIAYPKRPTKEQYRLQKEEGYTIFHSIPVRINNRTADFNLMMWTLNKNYRNQCYIQLKRDFTTFNVGNITASTCFTAINEGFGYNEKLLGGYFTPLSIQVEEEVDAAVQILGGKHPSDMPIVESKKQYMVDWNAMQQLDIPKERIPSHYVIYHIPFSEQYPLLWTFS